MSIYLGTDTVKKVFLGTNEVKEVWLGTEMIYSKDNYSVLYHDGGVTDDKNNNWTKTRITSTTDKTGTTNTVTTGQANGWFAPLINGSRWFIEGSKTFKIEFDVLEEDTCALILYGESGGSALINRKLNTLTSKTSYNFKLVSENGECKFYVDGELKLTQQVDLRSYSNCGMQFTFNSSANFLKYKNFIISCKEVYYDVVYRDSGVTDDYNDNYSVVRLIKTVRDNNTLLTNNSGSFGNQRPTINGNYNWIDFTKDFKITVEFGAVNGSNSYFSIYDADAVNTAYTRINIFANSKLEIVKKGNDYLFYKDNVFTSKTSIDLGERGFIQFGLGNGTSVEYKDFSISYEQIPYFIVYNDEGVSSDYNSNWIKTNCTSSVGATDTSVTATANWSSYIPIVNSTQYWIDFSRDVKLEVTIDSYTKSDYNNLQLRFYDKNGGNQNLLQVNNITNKTSSNTPFKITIKKDANGNYKLYKDDVLVTNSYVNTFCSTLDAYTESNARFDFRLKGQSTDTVTMNYKKFNVSYVNDYTYVVYRDGGVTGDYSNNWTKSRITSTTDNKGTLFEVTTGESGGYVRTTLNNSQWFVDYTKDVKIEFDVLSYNLDTNNGVLLNLIPFSTSTSATNITAQLKALTTKTSFNVKIIVENNGTAKFYIDNELKTTITKDFTDRTNGTFQLNVNGASNLKYKDFSITYKEE